MIENTIAPVTLHDGKHALLQVPCHRVAFLLLCTLPFARFRVQNLLSGVLVDTGSATAAEVSRFDSGFYTGIFLGIVYLRVCLGISITYRRGGFSVSVKK